MLSNEWPWHKFPLGLSFRETFSLTLPGIVMALVDQSLLHKVSSHAKHTHHISKVSLCLASYDKNLSPFSFLTQLIPMLMSIQFCTHSHSILLSFLTRCQCFALCTLHLEIFEGFPYILWPGRQLSRLSFLFVETQPSKYLFTCCQLFVFLGYLVQFSLFSYW